MGLARQEAAVARSDSNAASLQAGALLRAPRPLRSASKYYEGSDGEEEPEQALADPSIPAQASSSKRDVTEGSGRPIPKAVDTRPEEIIRTISGDYYNCV